MKHIWHVSIAECATPFLLKGQPAADVLGRVVYMSVLDVASMHAWLTNVVSGVPLVGINVVV